jgi:hypothetical protein
LKKTSLLAAGSAIVSRDADFFAAGFFAVRERRVAIEHLR